MIRLIWLRILGVLISAMLIIHAGLGSFADLVRPAFGPNDIFLDRDLPTQRGSEISRIAASFSFDEDLLANSAAVKIAEVLRQSIIDYKHQTNISAAQEAVIQALKISPIRPALWLALGMLKSALNEPVTPALKMSYLTGQVPIQVALSRIQAVTTTSVAADEEIKLFAQSDIRNVLAGGIRFEAGLIATYVQATPAGKSLLLDATQTINPKFNVTLQRY